jgi:hypothetical protein
MPRKAPGPNNGVTEHRITLGDFERKQLVQAIDAYQRDKWLENVPYLMLGTAAVGAATAVGFVGYALYYWLDSVPSIKDVVDELNPIKRADEFGDKLMSGLNKTLNRELGNYSLEELTALRQADFDALNRLESKANQYAASDSFIMKNLGIKMLSKLPAQRKKVADEWADKFERWHQIQKERAKQNQNQ